MPQRIIIELESAEPETYERTVLAAASILGPRHIPAPIVFDYGLEIQPPIVYTPIVTVAAGAGPPMPPYTVQRFNCTRHSDGSAYIIPYLTLNNPLVPSTVYAVHPPQTQCNTQGVLNWGESLDPLWYQTMTINPPLGAMQIQHRLFAPFLPAPQNAIAIVNQFIVTIHGCIRLNGIPAFGGNPAPGPILYAWRFINGTTNLFLQQPTA